MTPRIFLIHPNAQTVAPIQSAFQRLWPEASAFNLMDESLYSEVDDLGTMTPALVRRVRLLFEYAREARAEGIIFTGSTFGPAVDHASAGLGVPVLKPDEALAEAAVARGRRIAVLCSAKRAIPVITTSIEQAAATAGQAVTITGHWVPHAQPALVAGRRDEHDRLVADRATQIPDCDVLVIGQISMAPAAQRIVDVAGRTVLTSPDTAIAKMRALLS